MQEHRCGRNTHRLTVLHMAAGPDRRSCVDALGRSSWASPGMRAHTAGMHDELELIGGVEKREIRVVDYDAAWPLRFQAQRERIVRALGDVACRVDHIGSTAIPGMAAKPIVDIDLSVPDVEDERAYLGPLLAAGYRLRVREPRHRMVRTRELDVQVHVCSAGSEWERRHLLFRDWLRHDAADREAYARLKWELASRDWDDMNQYADAKSALVAQITVRAEAWALANGWAVE